MTTKNALYDIVLKNGRVIDPETYFDKVCNVGIKDGNVAAISEDPLSGKEETDVTGMIVSPGFIDLHCHSQNIPSNRMQAFDGVCTALELEAGVLPVGEFYDNCAKEGRPINYGASSGWAFARVVTMNPEAAVNGKPVPNVAFMFGNLAKQEWVENTPTAEQLKEILALTEQGLKEGGIGIGVPWGYAPGAGLGELGDLWSMAAKYNQPTYTHVQNLSVVEPHSGRSNMIELMGLAAATGAHTHVCHWNSTSLRDIPKIREIVKNAQDRGLNVTTEAYVWGAGASGIGAAEFNPDDIQARLQINWSDLTLVKTMKDFSSKEEFVKARTEGPADSVIVHFLREDTDPEDAALFDMSVLYPGTAICTDCIPYTTPEGTFYEGTEWPLPEGLSNHPRQSGNYTRFLRKWVRERGVISWMDAIKQASLNSAIILGDSVPGMKKKGRLQVGMDADIVVFDPETVAETSSFQNPCTKAKGMHHVIVNGEFLIRDEKLDVNAFPGQPVRAPIHG